MPEHLSTCYDADDAWVLCLRAHIDGGPTDQPAQWDWSRPELVPGWESSPEVVALLKTLVHMDCLVFKLQLALLPCQRCLTGAIGAVSQVFLVFEPGQVAGTICLRHIAVVYVADPVMEEARFQIQNDVLTL